MRPNAPRSATPASLLRQRSANPLLLVVSESLSVVAASPSRISLPLSRVFLDSTSSLKRSVTPGSISFHVIFEIVWASMNQGVHVTTLSPLSQRASEKSRGEQSIYRVPTRAVSYPRIAAPAPISHKCRRIGTTCWQQGKTEQSRTKEKRHGTRTKTRSRESGDSGDSTEGHISTGRAEKAVSPGPPRKKTSAPLS